MASPADIQAVHWFARQCQMAAGAFLDPADSIETLNAVYAAIDAAPAVYSVACISSVALAVAGLGRSLLKWHAGRESFADSAAKRTARAGIARALDRVLSHHTRPSLKLRAIASEMGIGEAYLCDGLKTISGRGFLGHLQTIRVLHVAV